MTRTPIVALSFLAATALAAPNAFAWGAYRGGGGGGYYRGSFAGSFAHSGSSWGAIGPRGSTASGNGRPTRLPLVQMGYRGSSGGDGWIVRFIGLEAARGQAEMGPYRLGKCGERVSGILCKKEL